MLKKFLIFLNNWCLREMTEISPVHWWCGTSWASHSKEIFCPITAYTVLLGWIITLGGPEYLWTKRLEQESKDKNGEMFTSMYWLYWSDLRRFTNINRFLCFTNIIHSNFERHQIKGQSNWNKILWSAPLDLY